MRLPIGLTCFVLAAVLAGCERDNPAPADGGPRPDAQIGADSGADGGPFDAGPDIDAELPDADLPDADLPDATVIDAGACTVDGGTCFACPPTTSDQLLNSCTGATCEPFPITTARLPLLRADGTVPPLP